MVGRFLVTTALEDTWPADDVPVLFLGEWCRLYERKSAWEKRDAVVASYHWDNRKKLHNDYLYLQSLYEELLEELANKLNELHNVDRSVRYWRVIVGLWLGYFIQMLFDRWEMLKQAVSENEISGVRVLSHGDGYLVPNDMESFNRMYIDDAWNELICGQILESMGVSVQTIDAECRTFDTPYTANTTSLLRRIKRRLADAFSFVSGAICRDDEYFFMSSYLGVRQDLLLQMHLGQLPKLWRPVPVPVAVLDRGMRHWRISTPETKDDFAKFASSLIPHHFPTAYLEGYRALVSLTESLPWPKSPKAIFTSNSFCVDDVFKVWSAAQVECGVPLIIGQHGGNYGMAKWNFHEEHEIAISDQYLTWGWGVDGMSVVTPVGNLKNFGKKVIPDIDGVALMVEMVMPRTSYHMYSVPVASQWMNYFDDQIRFVQELPKHLQDRLLVRLFPQEFGWGQRKRWKDLFPNLDFDIASKSMTLMMEKSRILVSTYNATTYLESMSLNFPTIMFWNPIYWELRESAVPYFEKLKLVGIFHETPESAARQLVKVWDDVSGWWLSSEVQAVRTEFCNHYAKIPENPIAVMKSFFCTISNDNRDLHHTNMLNKAQ